MISDEYLGGEATSLPFFLDREGKDLECLGGEGVATGEDGWSDGLVGTQQLHMLQQMEIPSSSSVRKAVIWVEARLGGSAISQTRSSERCLQLASELSPSAACLGNDWRIRCRGLYCNRGGHVRLYRRRLRRRQRRLSLLPFGGRDGSPSFGSRPLLGRDSFSGSHHSEINKEKKIRAST